MMKVVGSHLCPDTLYAINVLKSKDIPFEFVNLSADLAHLKIYLSLRESTPVFDAVRQLGSIGIPTFVKEDGTVTLELKDVM